MNSKITIGVTGGIGSGKSIVCRIIHTMGYPVFYSDQSAKEILSSDPEVRAQLISLLGIEAYNGTELNRSYIAGIVFSNPDKLAAINNIVHPAVRRAFQEWSVKQKSNMVFNEAAILFETGAYKNFSTTILVTAPDDVRVNRVSQRDGLSAAEVEDRIRNQWPEAKKKELATYCIENDNVSLVIPQVLNILDQIKNSASLE